MKKRFSLLLIAFLATLTVAGKTYTLKSMPNPQIDDASIHLVNPDGIISDAAAEKINSILLDTRKKSSAEVVAVIVDDIDTDDIDTFASDLFKSWGIGKKDKNNGILLIVAKDSRMATIRTGYGAEGVLPDILCGRILRNKMVPQMKKENFDSAMLAGVSEIHRIATDSVARAELMSKQADKRTRFYRSPLATKSSKRFDFDGFEWYLYAGCAVAVIMLILYIMAISKKRTKDGKPMDNLDRYRKLDSYSIIFLVLSIFFLLIPLPVYLLLLYTRRCLRNKPRICQNCGTTMQKLSEEEDNRYLNPSQDTEDRLKSIDYDVWLCPECGETEIIPYRNPSSMYSDCPKCHTMALKITKKRIIKRPTTKETGIEEQTYQCAHCGHTTTKRVTLPREERTAGALGVIGGIAAGSSRGGGFGGGFGGGSTGGGGASVRW